MPKYRKTALVDAEQFLPKEGKIPTGVTSDGMGSPLDNPDKYSFILRTLEGFHYLRDGDYICTGFKGERWNVEKSIFENTYELVHSGEEYPVDLYLEAHVTIEPVFDERRAEAAEIAKLYNFKLAHLLMKKDREATEERSDRDTFMTGHSKFKSDINQRTKELVKHLKQEGFKVWRYKVEDTLLDSKLKDIWELL